MEKEKRGGERESGGDARGAPRRMPPAPAELFHCHRTRLPGFSEEPVKLPLKKRQRGTLVSTLGVRGVGWCCRGVCVRVYGGAERGWGGGWRGGEAPARAPEHSPCVVLIHRGPHASTDSLHTDHSCLPLSLLCFQAI